MSPIDLPINLPINLNDVSNYVEDNIKKFHDARLLSVDSLSLTKVLKRKNPYLFRAKNVLTSGEIVKGIVDAHISSNEETLFGNWLEKLALFVASKVYGAWKSGMEGIDIEFNHDNIRHIVTVKSGPNWANSGQLSKMLTTFDKAKRILKTSDSKLRVVCVNGCCYGRDKNPYKGTYYKYCGQEFWKFLSGSETLYADIIEPLGHKAKERNDGFAKAYSQRINLLTLEFGNKFCDAKGNIDWVSLVKFNSSSIAVKY